jgi:hypothetical protein
MRLFSARSASVIAKASLVLGLLAVVPVRAFAGIIDQYASTVIGFSSQYSSTRNAAIQALGPPNVLSAGENYYAWAAAPRDGSTQEYISLGFAIPVNATGVTIRETMGSAFVTQIDLLDMAGVWHTVWAGTDTSPWYPGSYWWKVGGKKGEIAEFNVSFDKTPFLVSGVRISMDPNSNPGLWEEIDSVQLHGTVPEAASWILLAIGVLSAAGFRLRQRS